MLFRICTFIKPWLLTSLFALVLLNNSAFATFPEPDELARMIKFGKARSICKAIEDYKNEFNEELDRISTILQKPIKSAEEKRALLKEKMEQKLNLQDSEGFTPLQRVAKFATCFSQAEDFKKVVAALVQNGANPRSPFRLEGTKKLHTAHLHMMNYPPIALLLQDVHLPLDYMHSFLDVTHLNGEDLDTVLLLHGKSISPLYGCLKYCDLKIAQALIDARANPNLILEDQPMNTPLKTLLARIKNEKVLVIRDKNTLPIRIKGKLRPMSTIGIQLAGALIRKGADPREELTQALSSEQLYGSSKLFHAMMEASLDSPVLEIREWANDYRKRKLEDLEEHREAEKTFLRLLDQQEEQKTAEKASALSEATTPSREEKTPEEPKSIEVAVIEEQADGEGPSRNTRQEPALEVSTRKDSPLQKHLQKRGSFSKTKKSKDLEQAYSAEESREGQWIVVTRDLNLRPKPKRPFRFGQPFQVGANGKLIDVVFSDDFEEHVQERHREVGNHDLTPDEIIDILDHPNAILLQKDAERIRYVFFALMPSSQVARVVVSKSPWDLHFVAVTAYKQARP